MARPMPSAYPTNDDATDPMDPADAAKICFCFLPFLPNSLQLALFVPHLEPSVNKSHWLKRSALCFPVAWAPPVTIQTWREYSSFLISAKNKCKKYSLIKSRATSLQIPACHHRISLKSGRGKCGHIVSLKKSSTGSTRKISFSKMSFFWTVSVETCGVAKLMCFYHPRFYSNAIFGYNPRFYSNAIFGSVAVWDAIKLQSGGYWK